MKRFTYICWIVFCLSVFQNGRATAGKCVLCKFGSIIAHTNSSITKQNTDKLKSRNSMTVILKNSILVKTSLDHHTETDLLSSIKTAEDLIRFSSQTSLADLSLPEKEAVVLVMSSVYGHTTDPLPPASVINLVGMLACTPTLFSTLSQECLNSVLSTLAVNQCALYQVPAKNSVLFLNGLLSQSPRVLNGIPKSIFVSILGATITSSDVLIDLPHSSAMNLITALSMSKSTFNCLPLPTLLSLLTFMASKSPSKLMSTLPPSTVFGFLDGLLDTLVDSSSPFLINTIPTSVLAAIFNPVMNSNMLSVMPIDSFDLLLSVISSSQALSKSLQISNFISMFNVLTNSPIVLSSLNPISVAKMLNVVAACPSILESLPPNLNLQLLDSINVYLPSSLVWISANDYSLLFRKNN